MLFLKFWYVEIYWILDKNSAYSNFWKLFYWPGGVKQVSSYGPMEAPAVVVVVIVVVVVVVLIVVVIVVLFFFRLPPGF